MQSREYAFRQDNGDEALLADVHWQPNLAEQRLSSRPIVIIFHGGGFVTGSKTIIPRTQIDILARFGFIVVVPNYRLCPHVSVYKGPVADSLECLRWTAHVLPDEYFRDTGVCIDANRITLMGHSSGGSLALLAAQNSVPVTAVLDFYGGKYYSDPSWHSPTPFFANAPDYPDSLTQEAFSGPQISAAVPSVGGSEISPRDAWLSNAFKSGQHLSLVTKDGNYDRIDPSKGFSANFPPTMFIHGTADTVTPFRLSERAHEELKRLGVESHLLPVVNENHMFDMLLSERDDAYQTYVMPGLKFLATKAGLSYHGLG